MFIKVEGPDSAGRYSARIISDNSSRVLYSGNMQLHGELTFDPTDKEQYIAWDGELLHLKNGSYLKPLEPIPQL